MPLYPDGEMWDIHENSHQRKLYTCHDVTVEGLHAIGWQRFKQTKLYIPPHHHKQCFEFHYVQEGRITFRVDGKSYTVNSGQVFVNFPDETHGADRQELLVGHKMFWFDLKVQKQILGLSDQASQILLHRLGQLNQRIYSADEGMNTAIEEVLRYSCSSDEYYQQYAANQLAYFLHQLVQKNIPSQEKKVSAEVRQALDYMQNHLHRNITLNEIAAAVGYSLPTLKLKFKKEIGISPASYFVSLRINRAKQLLEQGYSITETANALDFSTPNYFATVFHRVTNMTPSAYKSQNGRKD